MLFVIGSSRYATSFTPIYSTFSRGVLTKSPHALLSLAWCYVNYPGMPMNVGFTAFQLHFYKIEERFSLYLHY
jgi:hypothetical protein